MTTSENRNLNAAEVQEFLKDENVFILDVRTEMEFRSGALSKATLIPVDQLEMRLDELPKIKSTPILVYCAHGVRSRYAQSLLEMFGYTQVYNLADGIAAPGLFS